MSILSALSRPRHFDDSGFADLWSRHKAAGTEAEAAQDAHLVGCAPCRARYASFTGWLDHARADAMVEVDDLFPTDRLAAQAAQISRRLEALDRRARVIAFPRFTQPTAIASRGPQRWIAAAAAGLIVGLGAGELLNLRHAWPAGVDSLGERAAPISQSARGLTPPVSVALEDLFLDDAESAITAPHVEALQALDAITPRVRDGDYPR